MLPSFEISNFRAFRHLKVESLGNVNLIVGKNNVGKSSFLEALRIYSNKGAWDVVREILSLRDEYRSSDVEAILNGVSSIFHGRNNFNPSLVNHKAELGIDILSNAKVSLSLTFFTETIDEQGSVKRIPIDDFDSDEFDSSLALLVESDDARRLLPMERLGRFRQSRISRETDDRLIPCTSVSTSGSMSHDVPQWWDKVTLTPLEENVLSALRVINPGVSRISLIAPTEKNADRVFMVKTDNVETPFPLKSLGEGMVRIIEIALAIVNAPNGIVLIDEIENGMHYSVQPDVWRLVFEMAARLNVQVFATSHSWDCIEAFQTAAVEHANEGKLIRLQNREGNVVATIFDESELSIISRDRIEVR